MTGNQISSLVAELTAPRQLRFREELIDMDHVSEDEIVAQTNYSAISVGTELSAYMGLPPLRPGSVYPRVVGYCNVATIVAVGDDVASYAVGDRILSFQSHRSSFSCAEGDIILKLPDSANLQTASATYLFHLGFNAALKARMVKGERVAVIGLGALGMAAVGMLKALGGEVYAYSDQSQLRHKALSMGAANCYPKTFDHEADRAPVVLTTSNRWDDWRLALQLAAQDARVCVVGFPGRGEPCPEFNPLDSSLFYDKQLQIIACGKAQVSGDGEWVGRFDLKRNCGHILQLIMNGELRAAELIGGVDEGGALAEVYRRLENRGDGDVTRILKWNDKR